ncbi:hypothetical protein [Actinacidiphila rubida]|uniref:NADH-ubiquinone oxidoreductase n=1 Tax=Actinacidiphila rubida TaxID=310780 RepID=A0A1H8JE32_9ACTN|nr:hypothetical protein [Actinacidiphila rubida]SEN78861.1 hypothetical protein SAMN05216267_101061 [Actinacidiphila rubida]
MGQSGKRAKGAARPFATRLTRRPSEGRAGRLNTIASVAFVIGGGLFAAGAAVAQFGSGDATTCASIYFTGGLFFTTGGYVSLLQVVNAPRRADGAGREAGPRWRWWRFDPTRGAWLGAFTLFAGTLVFGVNLLDSFLKGLSVRQVNRLIWGPDVVGCVLFLASGHLGFVAICHRRRPCVRPRDRAWWIVAVNQTGSVLFMVSALAAFTRPATGSLINEDIANWGTFLGALCFSLGGFVQLGEHP